MEKEDGGVVAGVLGVRETSSNRSRNRKRNGKRGKDVGQTERIEKTTGNEQAENGAFVRWDGESESQVRSLQHVNSSRITANLSRGKTREKGNEDGTSH